MRFDVITLMPGLFGALTGEGVIARALNAGRTQMEFWNPRDYTQDIHRTVDDRPYGGGPGMVMKMEPVCAAIQAAKAAAPESPLIYLSPQGGRLNQNRVRELARQPGLILLSGRYEGIDERIVQLYVDEEISIGDYVLSGGELAAMVLIDAVTRLLPGVLGDAESAAQDSYMDDLLDCPHFTRPEEAEGHKVPSVLLSGDHDAIRRWRLQQSLGRTWLRRPDLLRERELGQEEQELLEEFIAAHADAEG